MEESAGNDHNNTRQQSADIEAISDTVDGCVPDDDAKRATNGTSTKKNKYKRSKHECPFPTCNSVVTHLPRHMRLSHGWSTKDAQNVVNRFGLRKSRSKSSRKPPKKEKTFACPVFGCQSIIKRIHNHLTDVHGAKRGSAKYKRLLADTSKYEIIEISSDSSMSEDSTLLTMTRNGPSRLKGNGKKVLPYFSLCIQVTRKKQRIQRVPNCQ